MKTWWEKERELYYQRWSGEVKKWTGSRGKDEKRGGEVKTKKERTTFTLTFDAPTVALLYASLLTSYSLVRYSEYLRIKGVVVVRSSLKRTYLEISLYSITI